MNKYWKAPTPTMHVFICCIVVFVATKIALIEMLAIYLALQ